MEKWKLYDITANVYYYGNRKQIGEVASDLLKQDHLIKMERSTCYIG